MEITYYCHSSFLLTSEDGTRILTDPCAPTTGYRMSGIECDVVTSSHAHHDHNYFVAAAGSPRILASEGEYDCGSVKIRSFPTYHDAEQGRLRGQNLVFRYEIDGMRVVHLGDLGEPLNGALLEEIGHANVVMAPVGGVYTFGPEDAMHAADDLGAEIMIPMHYRTDSLKFELGELDDALRLAKRADIQRLNGSTCVLMPDIIRGKRRILVFDNLIR